MMGLLVHREVIPRWQLGGAPRAHRQMLKRLLSEQPTWWRLYRGQERVGLATTWWSAASDGAIFHSRLVLWDLPLAPLLGWKGAQRRLLCDGQMHFDEEGNLIDFNLQLGWPSGEQILSVTGRRDGNTLDTHLQVGQFRNRLSLYYDARSVWTTGLMPLDTLGYLKVGQKWKWKVLDPLRGDPGVVECQVVGQELIPWGDEPVTTFLVEQRYGGLVMRCWVDANGQVLRQQMPFGLAVYTFERVKQADVAVPR
jgi:hypothetical protein